jgi:Flp pilus assembly protein TadG
VTAIGLRRECAGRSGQTRFGQTRSGQTLVEFSLTAFLTVLMFLFVIETGRMLLIYAAVANAAREGVRYAIVHGSTRAVGSAQNDASGPSSNPAQVLTVIDNFAGTAPITTSLLVISVTYPGSSNAPGQTVNVSVVYPYNPFITYFPATLRLGSASQGVIVY